MKAVVRYGYGKALRGLDFLSFDEVANPNIGNPTDVIVRIGGARVYRTNPHITGP